MARSQKDEPLYGDMKHHSWNYHAENVEQIAGAPPLQPAQSTATDNMFAMPNAYAANNVYLNKIPYGLNAASADNAPKHDEAPINQMPRPNNVQNYGNAMLNLGNGQLVRVYYDENNQQIMIPVTGQYELFSQGQGLRDAPLQPSQPHIFSINQQYSSNNNVRMPQPTTASQNNCFSNDNIQNSVPTSNFLREVLGNWEPNSSGTYSPFGQNYPLNHPDAPLIQNNPPAVDLSVQNNKSKLENNSPKRNDNSPLADTGNKKRIVAEVKPMRPSYSDVLAKNTKNNNQPEVPPKVKVSNVDAKTVHRVTNSKPEKQSASKHHNDDQKQKNKKLINTASSGSESGDFTADDTEKRPKPNKKSKNKHTTNSNHSRKWSSLEDITKEEEIYNNAGSSQFVFIENQEQKAAKKEKKSHDKIKHVDKSLEEEDDEKIEDDDQDQFELNENHGEIKSRRKKESRSYSYKTPKASLEKKKQAQSKWRRNKPGYAGALRAQLERWWDAARRASIWLIYLVGDVCRMSAHLSFDLCTSVFTASYISGQAAWRSGTARLRKVGGGRLLRWLDRKLGHTRLGFWRRLSWFKNDNDFDDGESNKLNANISLPATGDEAMKRLLSCKGKDPYSILGVSPECSDAEIKRYYRRQAFLVHPDKNTQPGAEEAFKILQHAFDLIGEPERREAYTRAAQESAHAAAAWGELGALLAQLHDKMEVAHNTIRCTNCGRRHKRALTDRPCYAARYCAQCKIRHSAKEGDIWAESGLAGLLVMYYACMDGAVYQITQWASCQKKNLRQLKPDSHLVQYRIVLGSKAAAAPTPPHHDPNLEEFLNNLYSKSGGTPPEPEPRRRRAKKTK